MPAIALATYAELPDLDVDEQPLIVSLAARGIRAVPAVWNDPSIAWETFAGVVIRSCRDYHLQPAAFFDWIDRIASLGVPTWNAPATLRWNSRKTYLHDLAIGGVRTVPTFWLLGGNGRRAPVSLATIMADTGWERAVVKPVVSASAHETWKVSRADAHANATTHDERLHALIRGHGGMVQPFVPEIEADGEWSLLFFGGVFSHAVIKRAAAGDFRVQTDFGGTYEAVTPPASVVQQAERALRMAPGESLYARVDGVLIGADLVVTELELLEPGLFLDADPAAPDRFADAIAKLSFR